MLARAIALFLGLLSVAGIVYGALALLAARNFSRRVRAVRSLPLAAEPGVSILKPLKGADDRLEHALRSHCQQTYTGPVELLCGVRSPMDPACAIVRSLQLEFPAVALHLHICPEELGTSGKVATLVQLLPLARHTHILVNDADIVVSPLYLREVMRWFTAPPTRSPKPSRSSHTQPPQPVGMVTAPYIGLTEPNRHNVVPIPSRIESLGIAAEFFPGVLTARWLEGGIHFGLGSTLAMHREALLAIGGFAPLLETLADDYELGASIARAGFRVELAAEVVHTGIPPYTWRALWQHQLRWSRSTRDSRRWGFVGLGITFCLPWAILAFLASGGALWAWALVSLALALRVAIALSIGLGLLNDTQVLRDLWLLPLRDLFGLALWLWSFVGNTVVWRGETFRLEHGRLIPLIKPR